MKLIMSLSSSLILCGGALTSFTSCAPPPESPVITLEPLPATCGDLTARAVRVTPSLVTIQEQSNALILDAEGALWIVESGANALSRYEPGRDKLTANRIDVGNDRNPYDAFVDATRGEVFITNYLAGTVTVASWLTGEVRAELGAGVLRSPSGVAATSRYLYVSDVEFGAPDRPPDRLLGEGFVAVFDRADYSLVGTIATTARNPHYVTLISPDTPASPAELVIVNSGEVAFEGGRYAQLTEGSVEHWVEQADPLNPLRDTLSIPPSRAGSRIGAPTRPRLTPDGASVYLASATSPALFKIDRDTWRWTRGPSDPIMLYSSDQDTLHASDIDARGFAWIVSYNQDALYLFDTRCDALIAGPITLGLAPNDLEGPIDIAVSGESAYFITSLSKRLGRVDLITLAAESDTNP